jgi:hypothetical protein
MTTNYSDRWNHITTISTKFRLPTSQSTEKDQNSTQQSRTAILSKNKKSNKYKIYQGRNGPTKQRLATQYGETIKNIL